MDLKDFDKTFILPDNLYLQGQDFVFYMTIVKQWINDYTNFKLKEQLEEIRKEIRNIHTPTYIELSIVAEVETLIYQKLKNLK